MFVLFLAFIKAGTRYIAQGQINYEVVDEIKQTVKFCGAWKLKKIEIPKIIIDNKKTYTVIGIEHNALTNNLDIEELIIPEGIKFIDDSAFENCENLKSVELPTTIKFIGNNAFYGVNSAKISFKGIYDIKYGNDAFNPNTVIQVDINYQNKTFCGYPIQKSLDSYVVRGTYIYRILDEEKQIATLYGAYGQKKISVLTSVYSFPKKKTYKIIGIEHDALKNNNKFKIAIIVSSCCIASILIAVIIKVKLNKKGKVIDEEPMLQNSNQYTEISENQPWIKFAIIYL